MRLPEAAPTPLAPSNPFSSSALAAPSKARTHFSRTPIGTPTPDTHHTHATPPFLALPYLCAGPASRPRRKEKNERQQALLKKNLDPSPRVFQLNMKVCTRCTRCTRCTCCTRCTRCTLCTLCTLCTRCQSACSHAACCTDLR